MKINKKILILLVLGCLLLPVLTPGCRQRETTGAAGENPAFQNRMIEADKKTYLTYLGHSAFLIENNLTLLIDPYHPGLGYGEIEMAADLVIISHEHKDHNFCPAGSKQILRGLTSSGEWNHLQWRLNDLHIYTVDSFHDPCSGSRLGKNSILILELPPWRIAHLGDLGHRLSEKQRAQIGKPDLLMIPVGGYYTLSLEEIPALIKHLQPRVVIPMHFRTAHNPHTPIGSVEEFICPGLPCQVKYKDSRICLNEEDFPEKGQTEIWVMEYMLPSNLNRTPPALE